MEYYKVAAKWWADKLRSTKLSKTQEKYSSKNFEVILDCNIARIKINLYSNAINLFEVKLAEEIKVQIETFGALRLEVDSESRPDWLLGSVAAKTKVGIKSFSKNMTMFIREDSIIVSEGDKPAVDILQNSKK